MVKIIYDLLVAKQIVVQEVNDADYWLGIDAEIVLSDFHHIQVAEGYLILWECMPNVLSHRVVYDVALTDIDNTKKVSKFINKVKAICKAPVDDLYDYSAE
jgi:hypothetical protein